MMIFTAIIYLKQMLFISTCNMTKHIRAGVEFNIFYHLQKNASA